MPYIQQSERGRAAQHPQTPGELNFALCAVLLRYLDSAPLSYAMLNDMLGALEGAKAEFYRRVVVPYEEKKRAENGDVFPQICN